MLDLGEVTPVEEAGNFIAQHGIFGGFGTDGSTEPWGEGFGGMVDITVIGSREFDDVWIVFSSLLLMIHGHAAILQPLDPFCDTVDTIADRDGGRDMPVVFFIADRGLVEFVTV